MTQILETTLPWRLFRALRPPLIPLLLALLTLALAEIFPFLYPLLLRRILDAGDQTPLAHYAWQYAVLVAGHSLLLYAKTLLGSWIGAQTTHHLRMRLVQHLHAISMQNFRRKHPGEWMSTLTSDLDSVQGFFRENLLELLSNILLLLFAIFFMLVQEPRLGLATMAFFPLMLWTTHYYRKRLRASQINYREQISKITGFVQETLHGISLIQVFGKQSFLEKRFNQPHAQYIHAGLEWSRNYAGFFPTIQTLADFSLLACYAGGLWWISDGSISAGTLASFAWIASIYTRPLRDLSDRYNQMQSSLAAGERILALLNIPAEQSFGNIGVIAQDTDPAIECRSVRFSYSPSGPIVLRNLSCKIPVRRTTVISGPSGAGKSTFLHLLNRLYVPTGGEILLFGTPLQNISEDSLRRICAFVGQDPFLFRGSILDNILLGEPEDPERLRIACQGARIDRIIASLPQGLHTLIGAQGVELSRGQRQLIGCARAFYRDPHILILDEPTASIDSWTETLLQEALSDLMRGRTTIVVSHRPTTAAWGHQHMILRDGELRPVALAKSQ